MELRDLQWAILAAQHRSLRQAATVLNIRQSTLSRRLRDLEYELGTEIFERTSGGTRPTMEGLEFLDSARRIVEDVNAMALRLKDRSQGEIGRLTVGVHTSFSAGNLRATLIEHKRRFPAVETRVVDGSSEDLISALATHSIDIAFVVGNNPSRDERVLPVWSERVMIALAKDHALCHQDTVGWSDLKREALLLPQRGPGSEFLKLLANKLGGLDTARLVRHDASLDRLLTLVGAGWGSLLVLEGATGASHTGITFREIHDGDGPTRLSFAAYWRQTNKNPSLRPLLDMLRERYPDFSADGVDGPLTKSATPLSKDSSTLTSGWRSR